MTSLRPLIDLIEAAEGGLPSRLYHGTCSVYLLAIQRDGLAALASRDNPDRHGVYLTSDIDTAMLYADLACTRAEDDGLVGRGESALVLLEIDTAALDPAAFEPDDYELRDAIKGGEIPGTEVIDHRLAGFKHWSEVPWQTSLAVTDQVLYTRAIPPGAIRVVR